MEPAGLTLGVVGLASLFSTCMECFDYIQLSRSFGKDYGSVFFDSLLTMGRIENRLADLLGTRVDLSSPEWLKESIRNQVSREAVVAFQ